MSDLLARVGGRLVCLYAVYRALRPRLPREERVYRRMRRLLVESMGEEPGRLVDDMVRAAAGEVARMYDAIDVAGVNYVNYVTPVAPGCDPGASVRAVRPPLWTVEQRGGC